MGLFVVRRTVNNNSDVVTTAELEASIAASEEADALRYEPIGEAAAEAGNRLARITYNGTSTQWEDANGVVYTSVTGPKLWIWGTGEPDPTTLMATDDVVIGDGT